jgi:hypothetical protein
MQPGHAGPAGTIFLGVLWFAGSWAPAQSITGSIDGNVFDPAHLAAAGAQVRLQQVETGFARVTTTDASGQFFFGSLQPAQYRLEIAAPGFKRLERKEVYLSASETLFLGDLTLEVGAVNETIEVSAQAASSRRRSMLWKPSCRAFRKISQLWGGRSGSDAEYLPIQLSTCAGVHIDSPCFWCFPQQPIGGRSAAVFRRSGTTAAYA